MFPRVLVASAVAVAVAGAALLPATSSPAEPRPAAGDELAVAKQRVSDARAAATAAAAQVTEAYGRAQALGDEIVAVEARIAEGKQRAGELRASVERRALQAYTGSHDETVPVLESEEPRDATRRAEYLDRVNARDNAAVAELRALDEDLAVQREELDAARTEQLETLEALEAQQAELDQRLTEAQAAQAALEERLAREAAARRAAEQAAAAAAARQAATAVTRSGPGSGGGSGQVISGLACPVPGSAFTDSWGAPRSGGRSHQGTDMMAPYGAPNYAVISGTVSVSSGGNGGNMLTISGTDGNAYFYAHLQSFAVTGGAVTQGQLVGYVGDTGNATGVPHTHFEIRLGGSSAINPYPTLAQIC
ncbi:MAG TPA: peptidoglycan DD-metalloendopeptidase family protein [Acidimicrobiia bacterium]